MERLVQGTRVLEVDPADPEPEVVAQAAAILRAGDVVAFPTETVYGLGANALSSEAVARIFAAKGRPSDNPLIVHIADTAQLEGLVESVPPTAERLMERCWPGPLTLVMRKGPAVPPEVTAGLDTVGIRMPDHPVALALIRAAGVPIAAPSANASGRPSPTTAEHVLEDLAGSIPAVLDGGETGVGVESTVLDMTTDPPMILRPGGLPREELEAAIGPVVLAPGVEGGTVERPRSPGMKYRHYAPQAPLILVEGPVLEMQEKIRDLAMEYAEEGKRVGILCSAESRGVYVAPVILEYGARGDLAGIASDLFGTLRAFDRHQVDVILAEGVPEEGLGLAIMNRLRRAAGGRVIRL
ncbi:L-threonylcarbamoyladenylate synthase [Symbiobacterium thermophilum]|uniref:L-threonylcarbamoyladenylate synthase n=1 Tax=Symbiobacterium thermophilum TaxID=2734 RepID=UPI000325876A|nr:L-threonylcarbamoyladenylate synthase [Symbiobacterium thermophilum]